MSKTSFWQSAVAGYGKQIRAAPHEVVYNRNLLFSALLYATSAIPASMSFFPPRGYWLLMVSTAWDQGSCSVIPSLPGFQQHFGISSGTNAGQIKNFVSLVYIGYAWGAAVSFFTNDRIGRLWSYRAYILIYIVGQLTAAFAPSLPGLYASRIISGWGIGALTVTGPMSIVEIAPREIRGLLASWFNVAMGFALTAAIFCVYGVYLHVPTSRLQYQIVFFSPCIFMSLGIICSFYISESPRWLFLKDHHERARATLVKLRGLPVDHPRVLNEIHDIEASIRKERELFESDSSLSSYRSIIMETFTMSSNLRRVQQSLVSYALAQLSGANSITSYFVPILTLLGVGGGTRRNMFLTGMYGVAKMLFAMIGSFFFIDAVGRRKSLFIGASLQMVSDIYIGTYLKYRQDSSVSHESSQGAIAFIFIHAFGYVIGLFILPYVFGGELWPNRIRSFGGALSSCFHWLFIYAMAYGTPSLLENTHNWGAFIFFAGWCFIALCYVFLTVPETSGLSVEEIDEIFKGPWFTAYKRQPKASVGVPAGHVEGQKLDGSEIVVEECEKTQGTRSQ